MKYAWIFLLSLLPLFSIAQWTEDFSSTIALSAYPNADAENYVVNSNEQLQLNASLPGFSQLQFPLNSTNNAWEFSCFIRQNFAGSANNFGRLLLSINADADGGGYSGSTGAVGLMIQMGEAGSADQFQIFWDNGNLLMPLGSGFGIANGVYGQLKIKFDSLFTIDFQDNDSSQFYRVYTSDSLDYFSPQFLTLQSQFTSSNAQNFYWDDLYWGAPWVPSLPIQYPFRSIVINEIMADPTPSVGCPEIEYVELYNTTSDTLSLRDWKWVNSSSAQIFPAWEIPPLSYLVVCDQQDVFQWSFPVLGLENFLSLTNSSDSLTLLDATDHMIDHVHYTTAFYQVDEFEGGFSMEQIDPSTACSGASNWRISQSPTGGSPGEPNSILDASHGEQNVEIRDWGIDTNGNIYLWTSLPITQDSIALKINKSFQYFPINCYLDSLIIHANNNLQQGTVTIENLNVCYQEQSIAFDFDYYLPIDTGASIWMQELLFHPFDNCPTFVEVFNPHHFAISLDNWKIGNGKDVLADVQNHHHFIEPFGVLALSLQPETIKRFYPETLSQNTHIHQTLKMPYFTQSSGEVEWFYQSERKDYFAYNEEMHAKGLDEIDGKSLEKISPSDPNSLWITASSESGYATPGYTNSQRFLMQDSIDSWTLSPICFSPNGDGKDDFVQIQWNNAQPHEWVQWCIINDAGIPVYQQAATWSGNLRQWTWDGNNQMGQRCEPGMYGWVVYSSSKQYQILPTLKTFVLSP